MPKDFLDKKPVVTETNGEQDATVFQYQYGHPRTLIGALAQHKADNIALAAPGRTPLTYQKLREKLGEVGGQLGSFGVGSQDRVAIVLPNGPEMALSFLAVSSMATAAPLNPAYRAKEFDFFLSDLQAKFLIVQAGLDSPARGVAHTRGIPVIDLAPTLDEEAGLFTLAGKGHSDRLPKRDVHPEDIALVLHTSGTTARPKLIPLTHANLFISAKNVGATLQLGESDRCLNIMPLFHIHGLVGALLASLASGGNLVCTPGFHAPDFFDWLEAFRPTWYTGVPTMHQGILARAKQHRERAARSPLRLIRSSSAPLPSPVMKDLEETFHCPVIEAYGMTEAAHQMASNPLPPGARKPGSVGIAAGPQVTILDEAGKELSPGSHGEVAIRGSNVILGYDHNPVANQETFTNGWFRTGDQGYLDVDGYLFLTGRIKELINRGGEKIAPREVDDVLLEHPAVAQAVTFAIPHPTLGEDVAAAVVFREDTIKTPQELQKFVSERLADFKVPRRVIILPEIPKGPTGKLQRIGLAEKLGLAGTDHEDGKTSPQYVEPRTWVESKLIEVWSEVLRIPRIGIHDEFLELGGDSILATQILIRVREVMQVELSFVTFFESSTPAAMAKNIEKARHEGNTGNDWSIKSVVKPTKIPLTFSQGRLWYLDQLNPGDVAYNRPAHFRLAGNFDIKVLEQTINEIIRRHQALRTIFQSVDGEPFQVVVPKLALSLPIIDIRNSSPAGQEADIEKLVKEESKQGFNLEEGPLVRGQLVRTDDEDHLLLLTFHHIVFDGWSEVILLQELAKLYTAFSAGAPSPFPEIAIQYKDYALSQSQWLEGRSFDVPLSYWKKKLADQPTLNMPTDHPRSQNASFASGRESLLLSRELSDGVKDLGSCEGASLYMVILAAFQTFLSCYTSQEDVSVGTLVANRTRKETEKLIGYFVNNLVLRTDLSGNPSFREILQRVRKVASEAYSYQDLPFEKVLQAVHLKRDPFRTPLFQVMVVYHNYPKMVRELPNLTISRFPVFPSIPTQYELTLALEDQDEGLAVELTYRKDLFDRETITAMLKQFQSLLHEVAGDPTIRLLTLSSALPRRTSRLISEDWGLSNGPEGFPQLSAGENVPPRDSGGKHGPGPMLSLSKTVSGVRGTLSETKRALLEKRLRGEISIISRTPMPAEHTDEGISVPFQIPTPHIRNRDCFPLSFAQQRLWFLNQFEPDSTAYHLSQALRLTGPLNHSALEQSLNALVERHESLRTTFGMVKDTPVQVIAPTLRLPFPIVDVQDLSAAEQERAIGQRVQEDASTPFDLSVGPLIRATLLQLGPEDQVFLLTLHHIITDGWSMGIFFRELAALYQAACEGRPAELSPLAVQYADYSAWQRQWLHGEVLEHQLAYWRDQLTDLPRLDFPTDHPRPPVVTHQGQRHAFTLSSTLLQGLKAMSSQAGTTLFMTLLAAFHVLLARYSGQQDFAVGTPVANRSRQEVEGLIGFFVNTLVLRTDLSGNPPFRQVLHQVREHCLQAYAHQDIPFEKLVEELQPVRDPSRHPLFQVLFQVNHRSAGTGFIPGLACVSLARDQIAVKFDLAVALTESPEGLRGTIDFNTELFEARTMARLSGHFAHLLGAMVKNPDQRIGELALVEEPERTQLLVEWNATQLEYPKEICIQQPFEAQVERTPEVAAVVFGEHQLTYAELHARANQLAHYLQRQGVGPEGRVGLCVERSLEMVVGILGILKAGGAYVPLDPAYPQDRLAYVIEDAQIQVLLTQERLVEGLPTHGATVVCLDTHQEGLISENEDTPKCQAMEGNLAYLIYTSGSTGRPKGVAIEHRNTVALLQWAKEVFGADELRGVLASTSICFDLSVFELFVPLSWGGTVILAENVLQLPGLSQRDDVTLINTVPSALAELVRGNHLPTSVRTVNLAGEPLKPLLVRQIVEQGTVQKVYDLYGPSEDATYSTMALRHREGPETIGHPIANTQVYVLDRAMQPVPVGVPGELHLGGAGLARGYFNRADLTAEKFIPNPFSTRSGARLYRTGDLARYLPDGNIQFLGRLDQQVKIRGYRIELGEIETVLSQHPDVQEAVVMVREDPQGEKRLVGYVVSAQEAMSPNDLRRHLKQTLPDYMVPSAIVRLDAFPHTPNGKVDRRALPVAEKGRVDLNTEYVPPRGPIEEALATIWQEVLGIDQVGVFDNFFDLGGHSLSSMQVISKVERKLGIRLEFGDLLFQTLGQVAAQYTERLGQGEALPSKILRFSFEGLIRSLSQSIKFMRKFY